MNNKCRWPSWLSILVLVCSPYILAAQEGTEQEIIELSPFIVNESANIGYMAAQSQSGTRLAVDVRDIGSAVSIVTKEFLEDTGATNAEDLLVYTTGTETGGPGGNFTGTDIAANFTAAETGLTSPQTNQRVRGLAAADLMRDFFLTNIRFDSYNTQRVEIQRGPNSILFGLGSPAGIINNTLNRPLLSEDRRSVELRVGSYGSHRAVIDIDETVLDGELGVRIIGLNDREYFRQKPAYEHDQRIYATGVYQPKLLEAGTTRIEMGYENGEIRSNRPRNSPPRDLLSAWYDPNQLNRYLNDVTTGGNNEPEVAPYLGSTPRWFNGIGTVFADPTSGTAEVSVEVDGVLTPANAMVNRGGTPFHLSQAVEGLATAANNNRNHSIHPIDPDTGEVIHWAGLWKDQEINDRSIFDFYNKLLDGPNKREWEDFDHLNLKVIQTFFDNNLGFEIAYDKQDFIRGSEGIITFDGYSLGIDFNQTLADGITPNENLGRPYFSSNARGRTVEVAREAVRFSAYYKFDPRDKFDADSLIARVMGEQTLQAVFTDQSIDTFILAYDMYAHDRAILDITGSDGGTEEWAGMHYLGGPIDGLASPSGANIGRLTSRHVPPDVVTALVFDERPGIEAWALRDVNVLNSQDNISELYDPNGISADLQEIQSQVVVWHGKFLSDVVVGLFSWRKDDFVRFDRPAVPNRDDGVALPFDPTWTFPDNPTLDYSGEIMSGGVVLHSPEFMRNFYPRGFDISFSFNKSEVFQPASATANVYNEALPAPTGSTTDYGVTISAFDEKLVMRAVWYENSIQNQPLSTMNTFWPGNSIVRAMNGFYRNDVNANLINKWFDYEIDEDNYWDPTLDNARWNDPAYRDAYLNAPLKRRNSLSEGDARRELTNPPLTAEERNYRRAWLDARAQGEWLRLVDPKLAEAWQFTYDRSDPNNLNAWTATRPSAYASAGSISDLEGKGFEFELTYNPTRNWRITFNATQQEAVRTNIGRESVEYFAANSPLWSDGAFTEDGSLDIATRIIDQNGFADIPSFGINSTRNIFYNTVRERIEIPYFSAVAADGRAASEIREWRWNLISSYRFREGPLENLTLGGAARWQDRQVIGFEPLLFDEASQLYIDNVDRPIYGDTEFNLDLWARYSRPILNGQVKWTIQLNVKNVIGGDDLIPVRSQPNGLIAAWRIPQPTYWWLTSTFEF